MIARPLASLAVRATARQVLRPGVPIVWQRRIAELVGHLGRMPRGPEPDPARVLLYLHGGAFITGSSKSHRVLAARLAQAAGASVVVPDYRLAPEHPYPAALDDVHAAYLELLDSGYRPERIAVAGDSAGGQLALALSIRLRDRGEPLPSGLALISPLADLTLSDERVTSNTTDAFLRPSWVVQGTNLYARELDRRLPELSPLLADLSGLPPMLVHAGGDETLLPDAERLAERVSEAGGEIRLRVFEGYWHDLHLLAGLLREPTEAVREMGEFLRAAISGGETTRREQRHPGPRGPRTTG